MTQFIENQNWRYATKKFDKTKKISTTDLELLKEAVRLTASSYGLQPYTVLIIENPSLRAQIQPHAWGQPQITDASHLLVIANTVAITENDIKSYIKNIATTRAIDLKELEGYQNFMIDKILPLDATEKNIWAAKQTYIALGNLLHAAAELKIDATPMEGFDPEKVNQILNLADKNLNATLLVPIGYRDKEDSNQWYKKVRKTSNQLFITL